MNEKNKKRIFYGIPVVLLLLLLLLLLVRCHPETNIAVLPQNGALENDGIDEAELQKMMDDSMIAISINAAPVFKDGKRVSLGTIRGGTQSVVDLIVYHGNAVPHTIDFTLQLCFSFSAL